MNGTKLTGWPVDGFNVTNPVKHLAIKVDTELGDGGLDSEATADGVPVGARCEGTLVAAAGDS